MELQKGNISSDNCRGQQRGGGEGEEEEGEEEKEEENESCVKVTLKASFQLLPVLAAFL